MSGLPKNAYALKTEILLLIPEYIKHNYLAIAKFISLPLTVRIYKVALNIFCMIRQFNAFNGTVSKQVMFVY